MSVGDKSGGREKGPDHSESELYREPHLLGSWEPGMSMPGLSSEGGEQQQNEQSWGRRADENRKSCISGPLGANTGRGEDVAWGGISGLWRVIDNCGRQGHSD